VPRRRIWIITAVIAALLIAGAAVWWFVLRSDAPEAVSLEGAVASVTSSTTIDATTSSSSPTSSSSSAPSTVAEDTSAGVEGEWRLASDGRSFAGYRVEEELGTIGFTTAVGRSPEVTGGLTIEDGIVTAVDVVVDMTALRSDDSRRDGALRRQALETDTFPEASFELTEPVRLPDAAASGAPFTVEAPGELTLHGVTRSVVIPLEAQLVEGNVVVVGSLDIAFEDYDIDRPSAAIVLSVDDNGVMEFQLVFARP